MKEMFKGMCVTLWKIHTKRIKDFNQVLAHVEFPKRSHFYKNRQKLEALSRLISMGIQDKSVRNRTSSKTSSKNKTARKLKNLTLV